LGISRQFERGRHRLEEDADKKEKALPDWQLHVMFRVHISSVCCACGQLLDGRTIGEV
jgi:hypothetical protein